MQQDQGHYGQSSAACSSAAGAVTVTHVTHKMKYLIIKQSVMDPQYFMEGDAYDDRFVFKELYELLNVSCIQVSSQMYSIHSKSWNGKYIEISEDSKIRGSSLFSEVRETAKLWEVSGLATGLTGNENPEVYEQYRSNSKESTN